MKIGNPNSYRLGGPKTNKNTKTLGLEILGWKYPLASGKNKCKFSLEEAAFTRRSKNPHIQSSKMYEFIFKN